MTMMSEDDLDQVEGVAMTQTKTNNHLTNKRYQILFENLFENITI